MDFIRIGMGREGGMDWDLDCTSKKQTSMAFLQALIVKQSKENKGRAKQTEQSRAEHRFDAGRHQLSYFTPLFVVWGCVCGRGGMGGDERDCLFYVRV